MPLSPILLPTTPNIAVGWTRNFGDNLTNGLERLAFNSIQDTLVSDNGIQVIGGGSTFVVGSGILAAMVENDTGSDQWGIPIAQSFDPNTADARAGFKIKITASTGAGWMSIGWHRAASNSDSDFVGCAFFDAGSVFEFYLLTRSNGGNVSFQLLPFRPLISTDYFVSLHVRSNLLHVTIFDDEYTLHQDATVKAPTAVGTLDEFGVTNRTALGAGTLTAEIDDIWEAGPSLYPTTQPRETYLEYDSEDIGTIHEMNTIDGLVDANNLYRWSVHNTAGVPSFSGDLTLTQLKAVSNPTGRFRTFDVKSATTDGLTQSFIANGFMEVTIPPSIQRIIGINAAIRQLS